MSLEGLLDAIRAAGDAQVREIEAEAQLKVEEIRQEAQAEAQRLREAAARQDARRGQQHRARLLHGARLQAQQIIEQARQSVWDAALEQIWRRLRQARAAPDYPEILAGLIEEALDSLQGSLSEAETGRVRADPQDETLVREILQQLGRRAPVSADLQTLGGVVATSDDGRVAADNTLEARLERARPYLQPRVSGWGERAGEMEKGEAARA